MAGTRADNKKLRIAAGVYSRGKIYDCFECRKKCIRKNPYWIIKNIPSCFIRNKLIYLDSFKKIGSLLDIVDCIIPNRPLLQILETHLGLCGHLYINEMSKNIFDRYLYEKRYNCSSFGNNFDQVPDWWKWIVKVIDYEIDLIHKIENKEKQWQTKLSK